ncbi:MAG: VOC family protein [Candidatus Eremiobacteraeota bacterium]|nr:VOC family protein [Candidatus Eremiobacteraeota bacterium]MBC5827505.1 VOC family protein [Candidatus Eremiobacteraeota bacterium]
MLDPSQAQTKNEPTRLAPYIFFYGRCEEALAFYKSIFKGTYEIMRVSDTPMAADMPKESQSQVMHASFTAPGISFMASDGREQKAVDPDAGNISLSLNVADRAEGERLCKVLADGGKIEMPFSEAFWGGMFGIVSDRFGNQWMVTAS